jgi:hypothetical protein
MTVVILGEIYEGNVAEGTKKIDKKERLVPIRAHLDNAIFA